MPITLIENLCNEFYYEMFDYLDGYDIYQGFSNLNYRFQQLIRSSSLLFKIKLNSSCDEVYTDDFKQFLLHHKQQILLMNLSIWSDDEDFLSAVPIDPSLNRLKSLILGNMNSNILFSLLPKLTCLPCLVSITISASYRLKNLNDVYRSIFTLSKLKYLKCSTTNTNISISLPFSSDNQTNTIEHLVIRHSCTFAELSILLSYTPQLRRLNFSHMDHNNSTSGDILPMKLSNLTYMSFDIPCITFDEFEMFITNLDCRLKVLCFTTGSSDETYLDASKWEELILKYLPELERFYFEYTEDYEPIDRAVYLEDFNQFTSSFWTERKWMFETEIDLYDIRHTIRPFKKSWCDIQSLSESGKSLRLILIYSFSDECWEIPSMYIEYISTSTDFHHFEVQSDKIDFNTLINITHTLPELISLKIHSLSLSSSKSSSIEKVIRRLVSNENKITKICLENMVDMEEAYFLMKFYSRMDYLQINSIKTIDVELFLYRVLSKINADKNQNLRSLCIGCQDTTKQIVERLTEMINSKNLLRHYTIKCGLNNIYLEWENHLYRDSINL